jgi:sugar phosphate isomerase/epimerase
MAERIHAHVPFPHVGEHLDYMARHDVAPEIFFSGDCLDVTLPEQMESIAAALAAHRLPCSIHAPFMDLNPGSEERLLRDLTRHRFRQVCHAAAILKPRSMVFHPGYDRWRYGERQSTWLGHAVETFQEVLAATEPIGCTIAVENIFEEEPATLVALIEALDHPRLKHCFDVGHWHLFTSVSMEEWFAALGRQIAHVHIHDNRGAKDDHLPVGEGDIDFKLFFGLLGEHAPDAVRTIEAHSRDCLERAVRNIARFLPA